MYLPAAFRPGHASRLHEFIRAHPLGLVLRHVDGRIDADPIPLLFEATETGAGRLVGHVARANPLAAQALAGIAVSVIFSGPSAYVSPNWYPTKRDAGKVVPTWNYALVEARGHLRGWTDPARLRALLDGLTATHEAHQAHPWRIDDAPAEYVAGLLHAIVGIEVELESLAGKFKLSQNRSAEDQAGVVRGLRAEGDAASAAVAQMMERSTLPA